MKKEEKKVIPIKNYFILFFVILLTVFLTFYINSWIKTYKDHLYSESILVNNVKQININELNEPFYEISEAILYVGYTNDEKVYQMEKKLLKTIEKENLNDYVYYLNVTDEKEYQNILKTRFNIQSKNIEEAPMIIYLQNGIALDVLKSKSKIISTDDFVNLVEENEIGN